jgi:hypothetical protein
MRWFIFFMVGICLAGGTEICAQGNGKVESKKAEVNSGGEDNAQADSSMVTSPLGSFKARYERAGRPHFLCVIVSMYDEVWKGDEDTDNMGRGGELSRDQVEVIRSAFTSVYQAAGAKITFMGRDEGWMSNRQWPSRFFLLPTYNLNNFWREKGDMVVEVSAAYRAEPPSRWEMVALLYDVRRFGGLLFCVNSNELFGYMSRTPPKEAKGAGNLRTVSRRLANYLLQQVRLPAFDYPY